MGNCKYELNVNGSIFSFSSEKELGNFVKEHNIGKANQVKFSTDLSTRQEIIKTAIQEQSKSKYDEATKFDNPYDFLQQPHNVGKGPVLLVPSVRDEDYIKNRVAELKKQTPDISEAILEKTLKAELVESEKMRRLGISNLAYIAIMNDSVHDAETVKAIYGFIDQVADFNKTEYTKEEKEIYRAYISKALVDFLDANRRIGQSGVIQPYLVNNAATLKSKPDLVIVDSLGNPTIIDVTISRKAFAKWDSAKILNTDYRLGIQRQMLQSVVPMEHSSLYVNSFFIPEINGKLDLTKILFESVQRDTSSRLNYYTGEISNNLKKLIPESFTDLHVKPETDNDNNKFISTVFPSSYQFMAKIILENKQKFIKRIKDDSPGGPYSFVDYLTNDPVVAKTEAELEEKVNKYYDDYEKAKHSDVYQLRRAILDAIGTSKSIKIGRGGKEVAVNRTFEKYTNGEWELVDNAIFLNQDMFVFKNHRDNTVEVVGITGHSLDDITSLGLGKTLLGKFRTDTEAKKNPKILPSSIKNIESVKILGILNNTPEIFNGYTLSNIYVLNYVDKDKKSDTEDLDNLIYNFNQLHKIANKDGKLGIPNNFDGKIRLTDKNKVYYQRILDGLSDSKNPNLNSLANGERYDYHEDKFQWLQQTRTKLIEEYPELGKTTAPTNYKDEKYALLDLLNQAIAYNRGMRFSFDPVLPEFGIKFSDFGHLPQTVIFGEGKEYDAKGKKIVGILGGTAFTTTDSLPSKDLVQIFDIVSEGHTIIRAAYQKVQTKTIGATDKYYKASDRPGLERTLVGNATPYHQRLLKSSAGIIDNKFVAKNPYSLSEDLKEHEREYLKFVLWEMYKFKKKLSPELHKLSIEQAEKIEEFQTYLEDPAYFQLPLMKKLDINKWGNITTDSVRNMIGKRIEEFKDSIDPRNVTEIQRMESKDQVENCQKMYNEFDMNDTMRDRMIAEYKVDYFEVNLDTLLLKFAFASIRENVMDKVLLNVNVAVGVLRYHGYTSGTSEEMDKAIEKIYRQIRISIYGVSAIEGEIVEPLAIFKQVQKVASIFMITLRPILMAKELIAGAFKNISYSWTKVYGSEAPTQAELLEAYKIVLFSRDQTIMDFNVTDHINHLYGIANMDTNTMVTKTKTDRMGLFKFFSEHMYWMNTYPDYINRMTLMVAKMQHDGCYEAHSLNSNNEFIYDPAKDKRFKVYFEKRAKYNYHWTGTDKEYDDQRSLYIAMLESFNLENKKFNQPLLDEKTDLIPRAYTHEERESIKIFSDTAYGFYDHERSAPWKQMVFGSVFGQFLTYWPSTTKYYFGKEWDSKLGSWEQKFIEDENGNPQLLWLKDVLDEDGNLIGQEDTLENTGRKSINFTKNKNEGLMYSLGLCMRDLKNGNLDKTPEERKRRAKLALHDLFIGFLLAAFVRMLLDDFATDDAGKKIPNAEKAAVDQAMEGTTRAFYKAFKQFDPFSTVFTAFQWEPAAVGMSKKMVTNFMDVMAGNGSLEKMFRGQMKMLESIPEFQSDEVQPQQ